MSVSADKKSTPAEEPVQREPYRLKRSPVTGLVIELSTNPAKTEAYISISGYPSDFKPDEARLQLIDELKKIFGDTLLPEFCEEDIIKFFAHRHIFFDRLIARSEPPIHGVNAVITHAVPRPSREFLIRPDGTCDFKNRDLFRSAIEGEVILTRTPPVPGTLGKTVFGNDLPPAPARDTRIVLGKNVTLFQEDGLDKVKATSTGQVMVEQRVSSLMVQVIPVLQIPRDVDYSTGNINFKGAVEIKGSVLTGFSVVATGNIIIHGLIEPEAKVTAGGDLVVKKGILGTGKSEEQSEVKAFGNLQALYAENANITAEGDVFLRSAMNCRIHTSKSLFIERALVGGVITAFKAVEAGEIGNVVNMRTLVHSGVSHSTVARINLMAKVLHDLKTKLLEAEKNLSFITRRGHELDPQKRETLNSMLEKKVESLKEQIVKLEMKKADLALTILEENEATISSPLFFPGVTIQILSTRQMIERETRAATFYRKMPEERIAMKPYQPDKRAKSDKKTPPPRK